MCNAAASFQKMADLILKTDGDDTTETLANKSLSEVLLDTRIRTT